MKSCLPALALALLAVAGCTTTPPPEPAPQPERLSQQVARTTLEKAQQAYDEGDYAKALSTLKSGGGGMY